MTIDQIDHQIPKQVHPSFYETTTVKVRTNKRNRMRLYTHYDYEAQRGVTFGALPDLKERAYGALLDKGWVPTSVGCLAPPSKALYVDGDEHDLSVAPITEAKIEALTALEQARRDGDLIPKQILDHIDGQ